MKEVLDNLFELSKITPQVVYLQNKNEESIDESHRVITNADWYPDYGVFSMNKITMDTCEKIPEVSGNLLKVWFSFLRTVCFYYIVIQT